jgi:phosphate transport system protein
MRMRRCFSPAGIIVYTPGKHVAVTFYTGLFRTIPKSIIHGVTHRVTERTPMIRQEFRRALDSLRDQIVTMGSYVQEQLRVTIDALDYLDVNKAAQVTAFDRQVNQLRFAIEEQCFMLVATQAPTASDLRMIFAAVNMIVDLERMGDQTKGVVKLIPDFKAQISVVRPPELRLMAVAVGAMLTDALHAYAESDVAQSQSIPPRDEEVDSLFANIFTQTMFALAQTDDPERVRVTYNVLRAAREFERFGDLVANFSERSIYLLTGEMPTAMQAKS